jgi:hypothetical protein
MAEHLEGWERSVRPPLRCAKKFLLRLHSPELVLDELLPAGSSKGQRLARE